MAWVIVQQDTGTLEFNLSNSKATITGSAYVDPTYVTNTHTITNSTALIYCDTLVDDRSITLPSVALNENLMMRIKNRAVYQVIINTDGADTIDGETDITLVEKEALTLHADSNNNWNIL